MASNDCYRISCRYTVLGQSCESVFNMRMLSGTAVTPTLLGVMADAWKEIWRPSQANNVTYTTWHALQVRGAGTTYTTVPPFRTSTVSYEASHTGTLIGSQTSPCDNLQVAAVIKWRTLLSTKRTRGRTYMGGLDDANLILGQFSSGLTTQVQTAINTFCGVYAVNGTDTDRRIGIFSDRVAMNVTLSNTWPRTRISVGPPSPDTAFTDVTNGIVTRDLRTQRRRVLGVGA